MNRRDSESVSMWLEWVHVRTDEIKCVRTDKIENRPVCGCFSCMRQKIACIWLESKAPLFVIFFMVARLESKTPLFVIFLRLRCVVGT